VTASPILPIAAALLTMALATKFFVTPAPAGDLRVAAAAVCWILLGTLPTATFLGIGRDLQGARYLYLPSVGYALLLVVMARDQHDARRRLVGAAAIAALVLFGAAGTLWHQRPWLAAAAARDTILASARTNERLRACGQVTLRNLPDNVDGAYLFRNGAELAFAEVGLSLSANAPPACVFRWDAGSGAFTTGSPAGH
jgi:hypothetical protein